MTDRDPQWYVDAVEELAALSMFPTERGARKAIMGLLWRMVDTKEKLDWLTATMIDRVGTWHGPSELRGVYCTRFKPADGIEGICAISHGFTGADCEAEAARQAPKPLGRAEAQKLIDGLRDDQVN